jgi:hypothetical protein
MVLLQLSATEEHKGSMGRVRVRVQGEAHCEGRTCHGQGPDWARGVLDWSGISTCGRVFALPRYEVGVQTRHNLRRLMLLTGRSCSQRA